MKSVSNTENESADERYHHGDLKHALIAAALALLTEEQNWDFSLREVARRAGVSHNAPYNHFASKHALLAAVAGAGFDTLRERMQAAAAQTETPSAAFRAIGGAYVRFGVENPAHYRLIFGTALTAVKSAADKNGPPSAVGESATTAKGLLRDVLRQGAEQGHFALSPTDTQALDRAVLSAWSLVHGLTLLLLDRLASAEIGSDPLTPAAAERIAEQVTQLMLDGISTKTSS